MEVSSLLLVVCALLVCSFFVWFQRKSWGMAKLQKEKEDLSHECIALRIRVSQGQEDKEELILLREELIKLRIQKGELDVMIATSKEAAEEKLSLVRSDQEKLTQMFKALSLDALRKNNSSFLELAKGTFETLRERAKGDLDKRQDAIDEIVKPVRESLQKLDQGMHHLEKERKGDQESLKAQLSAMVDVEKELRTQTSTLVKALYMPTVRGRWGEMQLRRVVELAGMVNHCDFFEQKIAEDGLARPDLIVHLPGEKVVVVDAKTPLQAYLEGMEAKEVDFRKKQLKIHASHVRQHVVDLGRKAYWQKFQPTPEFVVLFLPSDNFFNAALEFDPSLIEVGVEQGVIIATPTTFIGLLRTISYGWKQETLSRHTKEVSLLGHELYKRISDMSKHWTKMGRMLSGTVEAYNQAVGSLETRVLVSARKFQDLGAGDQSIELSSITPIDRIPRQVQAVELKE